MRWQMSCVTVLVVCRWRGPQLPGVIGEDCMCFGRAAWAMLLGSVPVWTRFLPGVPASCPDEAGVRPAMCGGAPRHASPRLLWLMRSDRR
jgi:hypothetical protein